MSFMITAWSRWQQLRNPNVSWLALVGGGRQHHKTTRWEAVSSLSVCEWGSGSHMPGRRTAGTMRNHAPFERDVTAPRWRRMKPARELVPLVKPPHFSSAIWSLREAVGNGWVIPKEHKPSSQTYFSNALHFTVQVGTPEKRPFLVAALLFLELGKETLSDARDALAFQRPIGNAKYSEKCSKCRAKEKYFWWQKSTLTFVKCMSTTALFIITNYSPVVTFELRTGPDSYSIYAVLHRRPPSFCLLFHLGNFPLAFNN